MKKHRFIGHNPYLAFLTKPQAAKAINKSTAFIYGLIQNNLINYITIDGKVQIREIDLMRLVRGWTKPGFMGLKFSYTTKSGSRTFVIEPCPLAVQPPLDTQDLIVEDVQLGHVYEKLQKVQREFNERKTKKGFFKN